MIDTQWVAGIGSSVIVGIIILGVKKWTNGIEKRIAKGLNEHGNFVLQNHCDSVSTRIENKVDEVKKDIKEDIKDLKTDMKEDMRLIRLDIKNK